MIQVFVLESQNSREVCPTLSMARYSLVSSVLTAFGIFFISCFYCRYFTRAHLNTSNSRVGSFLLSARSVSVVVRGSIYEIHKPFSTFCKPFDHLENHFGAPVKVPWVLTRDF